ncbi:MAG TPA: pitrilysin family protein, partial [Myxococcales bacterium]
MPRTFTRGALLGLALAAGLASIAGAAEPASPRVARATLENGLRVVAVRSALAPVVTTEITYLAGGDEAPPGFPGMAHAQEHMMFRGSRELSASQLATLTAAMGGEFNAETQQTATRYYFTVPAADLEVALRIEASRMRDVLDTEALWRQERGAIGQEVASDLSSPEYLLYTRLLAHLFKGTPYAVDALGTQASFAKTTGAMLKKFHSTWYVPNNAVVVIAGDVDPDAVLGLAQQLFGSIPAGKLPARSPIRLRPPTAGHFQLESDLPYGLAVVAWRLPGYDSPDWAAGQVLADVLDDQRSALYSLVVEGKALQTSFQDQSLPRAGLGYATAAFPGGEGGAALVKAIQDVVAGYLAKGFPAELVEAAKRREVTDAELQKGSVSGLAALWSRAVAVEGRASPEDDLAAIAKVTAEDVSRVARGWLGNSDRTAVTAVLVPKPSGRPVAARPPRGGESFAPRRVEPVVLPEWARRTMESPQVPPSVLAPVSTTLPNGLRLIVQPTPEIPVAVVYGRVKTDPDLQTPRGQEGVDQVLEQLFSYGTTEHDRLAFRAAVDEIAAELTAGSDFSVQVPARSFERGVQLLAENVLRPALPAPAFENVRKQTADAAAGLLQSPAYLARRARERAIFPAGDPRQREATPATVSALKLEDVRRYHQAVFRPDLTTVVVLGQVTPEQARKVLEAHFGAWKAEGPTPVTDPPAVPPSGPSVAAVPDASRVQDEVTLVQTLELTRTSPDYYPLQLGNHVLAGGFFATRLYHDLREEAALVYSVDADLRAGRTRAVYEVTYACDPANVAKARGLVERDLRQMQSEPVSADELQQARAVLLRQITLAESSLHRIGRGFLERSMLGLPLDEPTIAGKRYLEISAPEV